MFTLNPDYALPERELNTRTPRVDDMRSGSKNRVGDFFSETPNRVGSNQPATLIVTIEIDVYVYESASDVHIYLYANAAPHMWTDPSGMLISTTELAIVSSIIGVLAGITTYSITGNVQEAIVIGLAAAITSYLALPYIAYSLEASLVASGAGITMTGSLYTFAGMSFSRQIATFSYMVLRVSYVITAEAGLLFCGTNYSMCRGVMDRVSSIAQNAQPVAEKVGNFSEAVSEVYRIFGNRNDDVEE